MLSTSAVRDGYQTEKARSPSGIPRELRAFTVFGLASQLLVESYAANLTFLVGQSSCSVHVTTPDVGTRLRARIMDGYGYIPESEKPDELPADTGQ